MLEDDMKYYSETEFLEESQNKTFLNFKYGETKSTIDLISIGIVSEDGREYYAVSKDFNLKEAWNRYDVKNNKKVYWIRENVLRPIFDDWVHEYLTPLDNWKFTYRNFKKLLRKYGKSTQEISYEIRRFIYLMETHPSFIHSTMDIWAEHLLTERKIEFYTYYGAYDHVVFCWLFGKMIDLPKGFPKYTKDLKQLLDEYITNKLLPTENSNNLRKINLTFKQGLKLLKNSKNYPKQVNNHNALYDAKWNKKLHEFIINKM